MCISKKLGLYISNIEDCPYEGWCEYVVDEFCRSREIAVITAERHRLDAEKSAYEHYKKHFPFLAQKYSSLDDGFIKEVVSNLVCIYLDYDYEDMPMGGWEDNPFDGRLCENDYAELIVDFLSFMSEGRHCPYWVYSSNYDGPTPFYRLSWVNSNSDNKIEYLKAWGVKFDEFLVTRNDYLELDYLIRSIYDDQGSDAYQLSKWYSLCQLFLENKNESELDEKLPQFIDPKYEVEERKEIAIILRQMRNKVAHGDFIAFEKKVEEYAQKFMDGRYSFDCTEYSRKNWALLSVCCLLSRSIKIMVNKLFEDKAYMTSLKKK